MRLFQLGVVLWLGLLFTDCTARAAESMMVDLWPGRPPTQTVEPGDDKTSTSNSGALRITEVTRPQIKVVWPVKWVKNTGTSMIIAPGGGFKDLGWDFEGEPMAAWCAERGITAFILKYRVPRPINSAIEAFQDGQRAVSLIRSKAAEWKISPDKIGMIGFSAGGGVAGYAMTHDQQRSYESVDAIDQVSCKLNFATLIYSAIELGSNSASSGGLVVPADAPPTFMAIANDDFLVERAVTSYLALKKAGVSSELHVYATGGHGFGWNILHPPVPLVNDWTDRFEAWLRYQKLLGQ